MMAMDILFKNGRNIDAILWTWRPEEGWFEALNERNGKIKRYKLKDVRGGKIYPTRDRRESPEVMEILDKAGQEGYNP